MMERVHRREGILGGCMVTDNDPNRHCRDCKHRWIDTMDPSWIASQEMRARLREFQEKKNAL